MKKAFPILLLAAIAAGAWFWLRPHFSGVAEEAKPVAQVQVAPLRIQKIVESLTAFGAVVPAPSGARTVALAYDAIIKSVAVSPGATVAAGDVIMEVDATPDAKLAVKSARGLARLADQGLAATRQRYELKLATSQDLLAAEQAAEDARIRLSSLEERGQSGDGRLLAPVSGIIIKLDLQPGIVVPAGTPLATIARGGQFEADLAVEAADAGKVHVGQAVEVTPSDRPGGDGTTGTVRLVGAAIDPVTGAVDVRVTLPAGSAWFAGEHLQGAIHVQEKTALVAPRASVLPDESGQVLYTVSVNKAVKHAVQTGISAGDVVEVIGKELHAGDMVVTVGNYELEDGMAVQVFPGGSKDDGGRPDGAKPDPEKTP